jgi:DNA (cytosine-5)-methyltransferase 1
MNELALFAGAGGGILGGKLLGWRTVCAVERDAYAAQVLAQRQNDGILEAFPIWSDVCSFDGTRWRGIVDVVSGGFPCQDISAAGKGAGIEGARSGMWKEMARIIGEVRPRYAFVENSPMLTTRGLGTVLADLASLGFDAEWGVLSAADVGANHQRERIWVLAKQRNFFSHIQHDRNGWGKQLMQGIEKENGKITNPNGIRLQTTRTKQQAARIVRVCTKMANSKKLHSYASINYTKHSKCEVPELRNSSCKNNISNANSSQRKREQLAIGINQEHANIGKHSWWKTEPNVGRVVNGVAFGMDRLKAIGNGQVPLCAATAFELLKGRLEQ